MNLSQSSVVVLRLEIHVARKKKKEEKILQ